jgi:hypothetical protein
VVKVKECVAEKDREEARAYDYSSASSVNSGDVTALISAAWRRILARVSRVNECGGGGVYMGVFGVDEAARIVPNRKLSQRSSRCSTCSSRTLREG